MPESAERVRREVLIEADPETVWEQAVRTEAWLDEETADELDVGEGFAVREEGRTREGVVEAADPPGDGRPGRLVWWWWEEHGPATRVEVLVVPSGPATRVVVVEDLPARGPVMAGAAWGPRLRGLRTAAVGRVVVPA